MYFREIPGYCTDCGNLDELRPYGVDGAEICYECGKKDPIGTYLRYFEAYAKEFMEPDEIEPYLDFVRVRLMEDPSIAVMP